MPKFKAAVVQAAPVYLDLEASVDKTCRLIEEAASHGAELIAFPETFLPGYPYWLQLKTVISSDELIKAYYLNSPVVPGAEIAKIAQCIRKAGCYVVLGVSERANRSLYNTLLFFDSSGELLGRHRKLKGTLAEKMLWADGDGSTLRVHPTALGKLSGLICGEHNMAIPGYILASMGEEIHVSAWVGLSSCFGPERRKGFRNLSETASKFHAIAYNVCVLNVQSHVDAYTIEVLGNLEGVGLGGGCSSIIAASSGEILAGPLVDEEGILYADIDLAAVIPSYFRKDPVGHAQSKCYSVHFDANPHPPVVINNRFEGTIGPCQDDGDRAKKTEIF